jgi:hypothetical protein
MTLVRANGTQITKANIATYYTVVPVTDPLVKVSETLYALEREDGTDFPPKRREIRFRAGQIVPRSRVLAEFPDPVVTAVAPATGAAAGGTPVQIKGAGFTPGSVPKIGEVDCTDVVVVNEALITCKTGPHAAGAAAAVVTTDAGAATLDGGFTYA